MAYKGIWYKFLIGKIFGHILNDVTYGSGGRYMYCDNCRYGRFERLACAYHTNYFSIHPGEKDSIEYFLISKLINNPPFSNGKIWSLGEYQRLIPEMDQSLYDFIIDGLLVTIGDYL